MEKRAQHGGLQPVPPSSRPHEMTVFELSCGKWLEIGDGIELVVLKVDEAKVTLGINCPRQLRVE